MLDAGNIVFKDGGWLATSDEATLVCNGLLHCSEPNSFAGGLVKGKQFCVVCRSGDDSLFGGSPGYQGAILKKDIAGLRFPVTGLVLKPKSA